MFIEKLNKRIDAVDSMLCVGLDPDLKRLPAHLTKDAEGVLQFCCAIVDVIAYIHEKHPDIAVILDAKRGDIGSTAKQYAKEAFVRYQADAVTLSPYMGFDTVEPYFEYEGRGVILLCRTSNPGGADIEELVTKDGDMVYERVAKMASGPWNVNGQVGLVVGATQPAEIARVRELAPETPLLVPGIGAQGGDVNAAVAAGLDAHGRGMIINSSRAVIFAGNGEDFAQAAAKAAEATMIAIREAKKKALS